MSVLEVKNIKKNFGKTEVLKGISFSLEKGEVLSIIGSSGSGKTTLLRCLNFLEFAESGTISVGGKIIFDGDAAKKPTENEIRLNRLHFGLVFQSFNLFPQYSVLKNVTLAPVLLKRMTEEEAEKKARELIARVGLTDRINNYPCQLSGGQQQRVAIARALAMRPEVMLFDEPTSALDPEMIGEVLEVMIDLAKQGMTMVVVSHEMSFIREVADKVLVLADGVIIEEGSPQEVFTNPRHERCRSFLSKIL